MPVSSRAALVSRAKKIKLVAMDVDGVLTAGDVIVLNSGEEVKIWNAKDRLVLAVLRDLGYPLIPAWITGRESLSVERTADDLGVQHVVQSCKDKGTALLKILAKLKIKPEEAAFIGDDLIDLPALKLVGFSACPSDAVPDVKDSVAYISPCAGGRGAVRDVLEFILKAQKKWESLVQLFSSAR